MSEERENITGFAEVQPQVSGFRYFRRVFFGRKLVLLGSIVILALVITAIFAPFFAPYNPNEQNLDEILAQPSRTHILGTDDFGRDTLSRVIYGSRTSLAVGIITITIAGSIGIMLGLIAGYLGGVVYALIMRSMDTLMSLPMILLALTIAAMLGGGLKNIIVALGIGLLPGFARVTCGQVLTVKENDYIMASRSSGANSISIMVRHVLPNCFPPLIVMMTMMIGMVILAEAGLSFLGIGIEPPNAAWGAMISNGYHYLLTNPILSFAPGLAVMMVVFAFNMIGDGLRDALDPKLRGIL